MTHTDAHNADPIARPESGALPRRRRRRRLLIPIVLFAAAAAAGFWAVKQQPAWMPEWTAPVMAFLTAGIDDSQPVMEGPDAHERIDALELRLDVMDNPETVATGIADEIAELALRIEAAEAASSTMEEIQSRLDDAQATLEHLSTAGLDALLEKIAEQDARILDAADRADAAGREISHVRQRIELMTEDSASGDEMVRTDLKAVVSSLNLLRTQQSNLSARMEALAGDLHLMTRFGYGRPPQPSRSTGLVIQAAPGQNLLSAPAADSRAQPPPPPDLVQGRYRVGDWVGGFGVVSAIRKTPEGDHLITPSGILFAPAPKAPGDG